MGGVKKQKDISLTDTTVQLLKSSFNSRQWVKSRDSKNTTDKPMLFWSWYPPKIQIDVYKIKIKMYMTLTLPIILYCSKTLALRTIEEVWLDIFTIRPCISRKAVKRLSWTRHVWRKNDSMTKTVIKENPMGKTPLGKPHLRWEDFVKEAIKEVNSNVKWREVAENIKRWRTIYLFGMVLIKGNK